MGRSDVLDALRAATIVGVVRDGDRTRAEQMLAGMLEGGLRAVEVTTNTPDCFEIVHALTSKVRQPLVVVGVGTVRTIDHVNQAKQAGATFVVSPHTDPRLIEHARKLGLVTIPGAMTPTEILTAREAGADVVKLFPIDTLGGARFVQLVRGPLADVPLWVSGGVRTDDIEDFLDAGVSLIGLTSALTGDLPEDVVAGTRLRTAQALEALVDAKEGGRILTVCGPNEVSVGLKELRRLPGSEHASLASLVEGRRGHAVRIRMLLSSANISASGTVRVRSQDGFERTVEAKALYEGGFVQYAADGQPLPRDRGGPLRLFIIGGGDQCDNVKGLSRIEAV